jgi:tetratricopeptide (TPR) repeat protein
MRSMRIAGFMVLTLALLHGAASAVVDFTASVDRQMAGVGDLLVLEVTISSDSKKMPDFVLPELPGFAAYNAGTSQNYQMINGNVSISKTWTYNLQVLSDEDTVIPALEIVVDGRTYSSQPMKIAVASQHKSAEPSPARPDTDEREDPDQLRILSGEQEHFATLKVSKTRAYVGEQVILVFRYYQNARSRSYERPQYTPPRTEGFWREELSPNRTFTETIGGRRFNVTEIRYALFPTRPGRLAIGPAQVMIPGDPFAGFFNRNRGQNRDEKLQTKGLSLDVRDLPSPRPANFSGLVSRQVDLTAKLDRDSVQAGEAVSLQVELRADGSLKNITDLSWAEPEGVKTHTAGQELSNGTGAGRFFSALKQEWVLVPLQPGILDLPPLEFSYFNPDRGVYASASTGLRTLHVGQGDVDIQSSSFATTDKGTLARLAEDLAFVHAPASTMNRNYIPLDATLGWRILLVLPILMLFLFRLYLQRLDLAARDPLGTRRRRAWPVAQNALDSLRKQGDAADVSTALAGIINRYLADKQGLSPSGLRSGAMLEFSESMGEPDAGRRLQEILNVCDSVRFAGTPVDNSSPAIDLISSVSEDLKRLESSKPMSRAKSVSGSSLTLFVLGLAGLMSLSPAQAQLDGRDPVRLVAEGVQAYTSGDMEAALNDFQAADRLVDDPVVFYNLGNTHARRGEYGLVVRNYLRAQRLDPRNRDLQHNLAYVRERLDDAELHSDPPPVPVRLLMSIIGRLSRAEWDAILLALVWLNCILAAWSMVRGNAVRRLRRPLIISLAVTSLVLVICASYWYRESMVDSAVVVLPEVSVHSGPEASFPVVFNLHDGLVLQIKQSRDQWHRVSLGGEWTGWVPAEAVARVAIKTDRN